MKKVLALLAFATVFVSCSDDDATSPPEIPFFNLAEGSEWVYKRYHQDLQSGEYNFNGRVDSVKVTGQQQIGGQNYIVLNHRVYTNGIFNEENNEYLRVNEDGHLVNSDGLVKHPGTDAEYEYTRPEVISAQAVGNVTYQLLPLQEIAVEGADYSVYPYSGYYTPSGNAGPAGVGHVLNYQPGIGLILEKCRYVSAELYYEDRLVYYELN